MSTVSPPAPDHPTQSIVLDAQGVLDFIDKQNQKERDYFDKLLNRFTLLAALIGFVLAFFGYKSWRDIQQIRRDVEQEAKTQLQNAINEEFTKEKIDAQIGVALQHKTEEDFQRAINVAVAAELNKPQRQNQIQEAVNLRISQTMARRKLTADQNHKLLQLLNATVPLKPEKIQIYSVGPQEAYEYAKQIASVFEQSQWKRFAEFVGAANFPVLYQGVVIMVPDTDHPTQEALLLRKDLMEIRVPARFESDPVANRSTIILGIGTKNY